MFASRVTCCPQRDTLAVQQGPVADHAAIGGSQLADALGDERVRHYDLFGQYIGVKLLTQGDEAAEGRRADQAADALGKEEDDDEAENVVRPLH